MYMKIAIPTRGNMVDDHFGHCEYYTIYTVDNNKKVEKKELLESPQGCGCKSNIAGVLKQMDVSLMLAGNMGEGAFQMLNSFGIQVVRGCSGNTDELVKQFLDDRLIDNGKLCAHHHGADHNHEGHQCNH